MSEAGMTKKKDLRVSHHEPAKFSSVHSVPYRGLKLLESLVVTVVTETRSGSFCCVNISCILHGE